MAFTSGTAEVGQDPVALCPVGSAGARVKNLGNAEVFLGGPDVGTDGYPLQPGESEMFYGATAKEVAVVPAPPDDLAAAVLYARVGPGNETVKVSWIGV